MNSSAYVIVFIKDFFCGVRDSLLGFTTVNKIDECVFSEQRNVPKRSSVPKVSTLARKRAEKISSSIANEENTVHITKQKQSVSTRLTDCCLTNGVLGGLAYAFAIYIVKPGVKSGYLSLAGCDSVPTWSTVVWLACYNLYFAIVLLFTKLLNLLIFQDIAEVSYRKVCGRPQTKNLGDLIADLAFSCFQELLFFCQGIVLSFLIRFFLFGILAEFVYMFHIIILHSLYTFEYKWFQMGWPTQRRLSFIEYHWPYFLGFGMLPGCLTFFIPSVYASSFLLAILFPFMIVGANEAKTSPKLVDHPLHMFYLVSQLTDAMFHKTLKNKDQYSLWISPLMSFSCRVISRVFSHFYVPLCCLIMTISLPLIGIMDFCKSHKIFTVFVSAMLVVVVLCSVIIKNYLTYVL